VWCSPLPDLVDPSLSVSFGEEGLREELPLLLPPPPFFFFLSFVASFLLFFFFFLVFSTTGTPDYNVSSPFSTHAPPIFPHRPLPPLTKVSTTACVRHVPTRYACVLHAPLLLPHLPLVIAKKKKEKKKTRVAHWPQTLFKNVILH